MKKISILLLLCLCACKIEYRVEDQKPRSDLIKSENDDVVCYSMHGYQGIWCYRKEKNPSCPAPKDDDDLIPFIQGR